MKKGRDSPPLTNFHAWQILKLLSQKPMCVRDLIRAGFAGSHTTLTKTIKYLVRTSLVSREDSPIWPRKSTLKLTDAGAGVLACFDQIGEIVRRGWQNAGTKKDVAALEGLPKELGGLSLEELRKWYEFDRRGAKR